MKSLGLNGNATTPVTLLSRGLLVYQDDERRVQRVLWYLWDIFGRNRGVKPLGTFPKVSLERR